MDGFLQVFDEDGAVVWTRQIGTALEDYVRNMAVAEDGSVFVTGHTQGTLPDVPSEEANPCAAAAAVLVTSRWLGPEESRVRFKGNGGVSLTLFVSRGGEPARPLEPGAALHPGDLVRFGVVSPRPGHALVASIDERGRYFRYHPPAAGASSAVDGREHLQILPGSVVLDDSLGREWIVLVVSATPLDERLVEEALRGAWRERTGDRLGPVALEAAEVRVVAVVKVPP